MDQYPHLFCNWLDLHLNLDLQKYPHELQAIKFAKNDENVLFLLDNNQSHQKQKKTGKTIASILSLLIAIDPKAGPMQGIILFSDPNQANIFVNFINTFNSSTGITAAVILPEQVQYSFDIHNPPTILCTTPISLTGFYQTIDLSKFNISFCVIDREDEQLNDNQILFNILENISKQNSKIRWIFNSNQASETDLRRKYKKFLSK